LPTLVLAVVAGAVPVGAAGSNWPAYLFNAKHGSYNASAKTITPANAATLSPAWTWTPPAATMPGQPVATLASTPAVSNGLVFIGASTGIFYALDENTGAVVWQRFVAFVRSTTCAGRGFVSSPTIARDPVSKVSTVYVAAADGRLYALRASDGAIVWSTQVVTPSATVNDYYLWSSPTVANGRVYLGISSQCDDPPVTSGSSDRKSVV